jgi:hypothetical protein
MSRPSRARRRYHRDRIVAKRAAQAVRLAALVGYPESAPVLGRLDNEQYYLGCHRTRCGICHPAKRWNYGDREREQRAWRRYNEE